MDVMTAKVRLIPGLKYEANGMDTSNIADVHQPTIHSNYLQFGEFQGEMSVIL